MTTCTRAHNSKRQHWGQSDGTSEGGACLKGPFAEPELTASQGGSFPRIGLCWGLDGTKQDEPQVLILPLIPTHLLGLCS